LSEKHKKGEPFHWTRIFRLKERTRLFDMSDVAAQLPEGAKVLFVGDSLMRQLWDAVVCDLSRSGRVDLGVETRNERTRFLATWHSFISETNMLNVTVRATGKQVTFGQAGSFQFGPGDTIREACLWADVLVFNFGLHWADANEWRQDASLLVDMLRTHCLDKGVQVIYRGTTAQHFEGNNGGKYLNTKEDEKYSCGPLTFKPKTVKAEYD
jgi:hypothetical protein